MARLWHCGFELNSATAQMELQSTGGSPVVATAPGSRGGIAMRSNGVASAPFTRFNVFTADQSTITYQRVYIYVASAPTSNGLNVIRLQNTATAQCGYIQMTTGRQLQLMNANPTQVGSNSAALNLNQWYCVEIKLDASTSPGSLDGRIDGVSFASGANSAQSPWAASVVGAVSNNTHDIYLDDWAVNDNSGSYQNSWCGEGRIVHLRPAGAGSANSWLKTGGGAGDSTNWQEVDEVTPDDATSMVRCTTLNAEDYYTIDPPTALSTNDTVNCVALGVRFRNNTASATQAFRVQIKKGAAGTVTQSADIIPNTTGFVTNASTATGKKFQLVAHVDPDGTPWSAATLSTAQIGLKETVDSTTEVQVTALWASVDYTPVARKEGIKSYNPARIRAANW